MFLATNLSTISQDKPQILLQNRYQQIMFVSGLRASSPPNSLSKYLPPGAGFQLICGLQSFIYNKIFQTPFLISSRESWFLYFAFWLRSGDSLVAFLNPPPPHHIPRFLLLGCDMFLKTPPLLLKSYEESV